MAGDNRKSIEMTKFCNKKGMTLVEIQLSVLLLSVIFLGIYSLYNASRVFYLASSKKVIISYELQYAADHIYKNVMTGIGDRNNPAIVISPGNLEFTVRHDGTDLAYKIEDGELKFDSNGDGTFEESLVPKITVSGGSFVLDGNLLTISLTGYYKDEDNPLTFYSACYPRIASF
ncbi:MAG: hypothetical protein ABH815_01620 [Candidatus Omnitrophota bacterium]